MKHSYIPRMIFMILFLFLLTACGKTVQQQISEQLSLGQKYLSEEKYEEAILAYEKIIEIDPKHKEALQGLLRCYESLQDYDKAEEMLDTLEELDGNSIETAAEKAKLLGLQGDIEGALDNVNALLQTELNQADKELVQAVNQEIVRLCFRDDIIQAEEITVNGKPFWEVTSEELMQAYPCDDPEDMHLESVNNIEIYSVWHVLRDDLEEKAGVTKFGLKANKIINGVFSNEVLCRTGIGGIEYTLNPQPDIPEVRSIKISDSVETVLEKLGFSEQGIAYIANNMDIMFRFENNQCTIKEMEPHSLKEILILWPDKEDIVQFELQFSDEKLKCLQFVKYNPEVGYEGA